MNLFEKFINKVKLKLPPSAGWKFEKQTSPPTFGWAKHIGKQGLEKEVNSRIAHCQKIVKEQHTVRGKISILVLTCKRWHTLKRLIDSMMKDFSKILRSSNIEIILIDNNSGKEVLKKVEQVNFFDQIIAFENNLGMLGALKKVYSQVNSEFILFLEDDFYYDGDKNFINKIIEIFDEYPEIGAIRLKNQNNWWKPYRKISPLRSTSSGIQFWTWLPSTDGRLNGWCAGSIVFRKAAYEDVGSLPEINENKSRTQKMHQGEIYECEYGAKFNAKWLTAKIVNCYPFVQPNDNDECLGWSESE